jgi:hypothetical protein
VQARRRRELDPSSWTIPEGRIRWLAWNEAVVAARGGFSLRSSGLEPLGPSLRRGNRRAVARNVELKSALFAWVMAAWDEGEWRRPPGGAVVLQDLLLTAVSVADTIAQALGAARSSGPGNLGRTPKVPSREERGCGQAA